MGGPNYRMFQRLGVYQHLCRTRTCQVITVNATESQEPEQLPAVVGERCFSPRGGPSPTSCCQLQDPCTAGPKVGWALAAHLSSLAEFGGISLGLAEFPLRSGWCWSEPLAGSGTSWDIGNMGPSACNTPSFPKQAKNLIFTQAEDLNTSHFCRKLCFFEMRNKMGFHSFPKGAGADTFRLQPWLAMLKWGCLGNGEGAEENPLPQGRSTMDFLFWESVTHFHDIALKFAIGKQSFTLKSLIFRENVIFIIFSPVYCTCW